jgi:cystathionine gamma-synthase/methionine-gamma-lyase
MDAALTGADGVFVYTRYGNPTVEAMEMAVAALEEQEAAIGFGSGMAALNATILACVEQGDRIVASRDLYGQTTSLLNSIFPLLGVTTNFVDILDLDAVGEALSQGNVRLVICESVSNPLLRVTDVAALAELAHSAGANLLVDSTFSTPYLLTPGTLGADFTVHSSTKYLGGHGDVTAGVVATSADRRWELNEINKTIGSLIGPFEAWLVLRGIKTLPLRMERQCKNAAIVADWLYHHPKLERVYYPGLPDHESYLNAKKQFKNDLYGGMVAFDIRDGTRNRVFDFMRALQMIVPATTLGDVHSLLLYPVMASHRALSEQERRITGIGEGLVRLSVGIEDPADIIGDLEQALDRI